jgi:formate dehydrogenase major subunit
MRLVHEIDYGTPASKSMATVSLIIDGAKVTVPEGTSVMRVAMQAGIKVPKLCATDMVDAFGSCRLCLVEIEGRAGTPASCTTPVAPGMVVRTQTPRLKDIRRGVMELYISDHPLDCLTCAANGDCELQDMAGAVGLRDGTEGEGHVKARDFEGSTNARWMPKDESNPYSTYDPSKCIVCSRCVRACEEVQGTFALTIEGRGFDSRVSPGMHESFIGSECVSLRRVRSGLPDRDLAGKIRHRDRSARAFGHHHLRLLRRRLLVQGGDARRRAGAHGALQGWRGEQGPFMRQGPVRVGLRQPPGSHPPSHDPRDNRSTLA